MNKKQKKQLRRILLALALLALAMLLQHFLDLPEWTALLLYLLPYLTVGADTLRKAVKGILKGQVLDENFLMCTATVGAFALGEFREGVAVMLFYRIGELFESYAVGKSRQSITALMDIRPDYANLLKEGLSEQVDPEEVPVGSLIRIDPGEKIPIDGIVREGESTVDTAALTGESVPRSLRIGDEVISGCVNLSGVLTVETTKAFGESTVAKILDLVENSAEKKSRSENFISRFARVYTPAVCLSALVLALLPPLVLLAGGQAPRFGDWVYRALTFLVISCPCALVISIPLSFFAGLGGAGKAGILIKGSNYLETLAKVRTVAFDKTGTVTLGVFELSGISPAAGMDEDRLLELAALGESHSSHPIARSIVNAYGKVPEEGRVREIREIGGRGIKASVDGKTLLLGSRKLLAEEGIACEEAAGTGSVVYAAYGGIYVGHLLISDRIKPQAAEAVAALRKDGVKHLVMLTGDGKAAAEETAGILELDRVHSELLPADKVEKVEELLRELGPKEKLAFVGDGINDAPVLARADVGIAMGALGSDAAIEAADVVLMDDDPRKIAKAVRIARKVLKIVYENIYFAIGVKLICLILGALGLAGMWLAVFADVGVMVIAVMNAVRALSVKEV